MVFTVPHEMIPLMLHNKKTSYNLLFRAAAESLLEFARDWERLRAHVGFTAILHTWNQDMEFHPHIHVVVTGGGLDASETRWIPSLNSFLVLVRALSKKFRGKFIDSLRETFEEGRLVIPHSPSTSSGRFPAPHEEALSQEMGRVRKTTLWWPGTGL